jgi:hypothetical protein
MSSKKASRHKKEFSSKEQSETMSLRNVKSSPDGDELKQSLTKLLNTGQSLPDETSSKSISVSHDDAWVEVSTDNFKHSQTQDIWQFFYLCF